jgi:hypothetical protein
MKSCHCLQSEADTCNGRVTFTQGGFQEAGALVIAQGQQRELFKNLVVLARLSRFYFDHGSRDSHAGSDVGLLHEMRQAAYLCHEHA